MKILFVTDFYKPHIGGVEKLFSSLSEELVANGNSVTYITWKYNRKLPGKETINGVSVFRISAPSRLLFSLFALPLIIREARKASIIHTSTYSSAIGSWIGSKITRKKIIITVHEVWNDIWMKMPYLNKLEKLFFKSFERNLLRLKFDKYIAVSEFTKNKLIEIGIPKHKIIRIYNGITNQMPVWKDPGLPFTFCFFGRAGVSKGLDILISASEKIAEMHPEVRFKFIISPQIPNVFKKVTSHIKKGRLNHCSTILSNLSQQNLVNELLSSNCVIIPSLCEGFGFTAVEASTLKIPLISSGMGSLPEVVSGQVIEMKKYNAENLILAMDSAFKNQFDSIPEKQFTIESFIQHHSTVYKQLGS